MVTFHEPVPFEDEIDSSSDFEDPPSSAEIYQKPIPKKQTWNKYVSALSLKSQHVIYQNVAFF